MTCQPNVSIYVTPCLLLMNQSFSVKKVLESTLDSSNSQTSMFRPQVRVYNNATCMN